MKPPTFVLLEDIRVVKLPEEVESWPIGVPSILPASMSTLLILTWPSPSGVIEISPFSPSVIVIEPVLELPVFIVISWSEFDIITPADEPVPIEISPSIKISPSTRLVIFSPFPKDKLLELTTNLDSDASNLIISFTTVSSLIVNIISLSVMLFFTSILSRFSDIENSSSPEPIVKILLTNVVSRYALPSR